MLNDNNLGSFWLLIPYAYNIVGKFSVIWLEQMDPSKHCKHKNYPSTIPTCYC